MKVTVSFGAVRVVVPCGDLLVRDLITESIRRYKKASGKNPDSWVVVHHLQTQSGILDPDDAVQDVADDREQIIASYDDHPGPDPTVLQGGGDGASGSSVGTGSPDIFRVHDGKYSNPSENGQNHIDVTELDQPPNSLTLQVRRGSEPSLQTLDPNAQLYPSQNSQEPSKRWSAALVCRDDPPERLLTNGIYMQPNWTVPEQEEYQNENLPSFSRSGRLSMQFLGDGANYRWIEAAEKAAITHNNSNTISTSTTQNASFHSKSLPRDAKRKEPLGQANASTYESIRQKAGEMLLVTNENGGPLGLTAIPDSEIGGLLVQSVEVGSRAEKGKLRKGDRILEINGTKLIGLSEASLQDQLRRWLSSSELRLRVIRANSERHHNKSDDNVSKVAHVSPTRKVPGSLATNTLQAANTRKLGKKIEITLRKGAHGLGFSVTTRDNPAGGHCPIYIKNILPKGAAVEDGRLKPGDRLLEVDNLPMTGKSQTEVVNILRATQTGAAVKILVSRQKEIPEVEEREIGSESTQPKQPPPPILPLKNVVKSPSAPNILDVMGGVGRDDVDDTMDNVRMRIKKLNSSSSSSSVNESNIFPWRNREILDLYIPVHDTEKAGLGVSVKGKTGQITPNTSFNSNNVKHDGDLGIFIKSVLHGGAASRDGRLKMNDQLLAVNGISLLGQSNADAMDTLRRAMLQTNGNKPGVIVLKIARRGAASRPGSTIIENNNDVNVVDTSGTNSSEQSGSTVIQLSPNKDDSSINLSHKNHQSPPASGNESGIRWSNPILDRLTGGNGMGIGKPTMLMQALPNGLRNESYYMATKENWSPMANFNGSNVVLIEEDSESNSQTDIRPELQHQVSSTPTDVTYASQLSLENPLHDPFSRDAIGRRSISEKHHAALDAKETGTYQRSKKMREERDKRNDLESVEYTTNHVNHRDHRKGSMKTTRAKSELRAEALDQVGELGPSLGMKKSSSLESLQTMVQELQMADEPRSPGALRAPRGRGREDALRAAVERPEARKHWLLEDGSGDDGGFANRGALQASASSQGKNKNQKKSGLLKGIGHMFRFGKHRKENQADVSESYSTWSASDSVGKSSTIGPSSSKAMLQDSKQQQQQQIKVREASHERQLSAPTTLPPSYNHPPQSNKNSPMTGHAPQTKISQQDAFNHRYSHYANYDEVQGQIRNLSNHQSHPNVNNNLDIYQLHNKSSSLDENANSNNLSDSTIETMRQQVRMQRKKVEDESRRNQHYHSQRSVRSNIDNGTYHHYTNGGGSPSVILNGHQYSPSQFQANPSITNTHSKHVRPASSFYEYETVNPNGFYRKIEEQYNQIQINQKIINGSSSVRVAGSSSRAPIPSDMKPSHHNRGGPFITQVHIRDNGKHSPASKV